MTWSDMKKSLKAPIANNKTRIYLKTSTYNLPF
jgi:hypothetical protein